jgi:hypothetical protein
LTKEEEDKNIEQADIDNELQRARGERIYLEKQLVSCTEETEASRDA